MRPPEALRSLASGMYRYIRRAGNGAGVPMPHGVRTLEVAYVILLDDKAHNYMSKLEIELFKQYGPHEGLKATPHITLKLGFHVSDLEPFERYFDKLVTEIEPCEIYIKNIGFFDDMGIIFMDVVHTQQLERLRRRILSDLSEQHGIKPYPLEGDQYHFHATLAYLSKHDFVRARRDLENTKVEFRFMLDTLGLICHTGGGWVTYKRTRLRHIVAEPSGKH
ncbi:MAG: 2'-5' RNA ligase family protein [Nitrospiraceae bacterium]